MTTFIIYDNTGQIFSSPITGSYKIPNGGLQFIEIEIPKEKILSKMDVSVEPHQPIYEDTPIPEIQIVKQQLQETQELLAEYIDSKYNALI
jgi:hypothetical protein